MNRTSESNRHAAGAGKQGRREAAPGHAAVTAAGPGLGPGSSQRRCELCGCYVPGNEHSWHTHTTGIRHRRNAASQRVFGEAGHAVVSAFEHVDTPAPATYRGKDVVLLATQRRQQEPAPVAGSSGKSSRCSKEQPAASHHSAVLQQLQRQLRKHLAAQVGLGPVYSKAAERFSCDALAAAWQQLQAFIAKQLGQQQQQQRLQPQPAAPVAQQPDTRDMQQLALHQVQDHQQLQHQQQQQQQQQQQWCQQQVVGCELKLSLLDPAQVACLAELLPESVAALTLTVPYQSYGPAAAASCAAVACFCGSLARRHSLAQLRLAFSSAEYSAILQQGGASLARLPELWGKAAQALSGAMQVNCGLQRLVLASFPAQFPPEALAALQTSLAASRPRLRAALLAATHVRLGAASPLARLPRELLAQLLQRAVPAEGCSLQLELPQGLAGDSSSGSSSSSSDDSDASEDEPDSSSSSSEDADEGGSDQT